jgi:hypothetical protein
MPSVIKICNLSLAHIGQGSINDINEASPQAEQCRLFYDSTRDALLRQFPWNFATKSILLSQLDVTVPGWEYIYQHPATALWVRKVFTAGDVDPEIPNQYEIVSTGAEKYICCDLYQAYAKCTIKVTDPALLDPLFVEALSCKLALALSMPLTNSSSRTQEVMVKFQQAMSSAMLAGAVEGSAKRPSNQQPKSNRAYITARR